MVIGLKRNKGLLLAMPLMVLFVLLLVPLESVRLGEFSTGKLVFSGRIGAWSIMLPLIKDHPFMGRGLSNFSAYTQSDHVRLLLETGILGWTVFLCLIWTLLNALHRAYGSSQPGVERNFALAYLAYFVCTLVISFSETNAFFSILRLDTCRSGSIPEHQGTGKSSLCSRGAGSYRATVSVWRQCLRVLSTCSDNGSIRIMVTLGLTGNLS